MATIVINQFKTYEDACPCLVQAMNKYVMNLY